MKILKKIATLLLAVSLLVPCFATLTYAADGSIQFTDPSAKVGEALEVTGAVKAADKLGDVTVNMTYDTSMLKFKSGDNVTETSAGKLTYTVKDAGEEAARFKMNFDVLKEGTTKIEVEDYKAWLASDEKLDCQKGASTVTIEAGEGNVPADEPAATTTSAVTVTVNGVDYTLSSAFAAADIPEGFAETTMEFNNEEVKVVQQESSGICLGYLINADGVGDFYLYDSEDATFSPFEQITISDATVITVLTNKTKLNLPKEYQKVTLTLNGEEFSAWQNSNRDGFYVLYAINNQGEKSLYQFDSAEGTYQRFEAPVVEKEKKDTSLLGKLTTLLDKHLNYVILGTGLGLIFFVVLVVILGVKLHNRNEELDELYEEYDIDMEEEEPTAQAKVEKKGLFKKKEPEDDILLDEEEPEDDFLDEEDDFDDDFEEEDDRFEDFDDDFDDDFEDDFDDDFEEESAKPVKPARNKKPSTSFDDFDMDFIDLDD